jgi:hypothetical protein
LNDPGGSGFLRASLLLTSGVDWLPRSTGEMNMAQSKSGGGETNKQSATEAQARTDVKDDARKSSHNHMSNVKAGTHKGAGGGAKQKRKH